MSVEIGVKELYDLVVQESIRQAKTVKVNKAQLIQSLTNIEEEIVKKHKEAKNLWNKSVKMYQDFLAKAPGSRQMSLPDAPPSLPESIDVIRGYINMVKAFADDEVSLEVGFLKEIFMASAKGVSDMRKTRDEYLTVVSGHVATKPWT